MAKMTNEQIEACYELGKQAYEEKISIKEAADRLVNKYRMNKNSAGMYIQFFLYKMEGKAFAPSINQDALKYYLENVLHDFGVEQLKIFLKGLERYINDCENREKPVPALAFRTIHNEYSKKAGMPPIF